MGEVQPQDGEGLRPAGFEVPELVVPVVGTGEEAVDHADQAAAAGSRLDVHSVAVGGPSAPQSRPSWRNRCGGSHPVHLRGDVVHLRVGVVPERSADLLLDIRRIEPRRDAGAGGDGLPDFLRGAGNFGLGLDRTVAG